MVSFAALLRNAFRRVGFDIVRYVPEFDRPFAILPRLVRERIGRDTPFFFIQVGANDGIVDDPLRDLIVNNRLHGLLIEPLPDIFTRLKHNYREQSQLLFENVAIVDEPGVVPIHRVRNDVAGPEHWGTIASFTRANLLRQGVPAKSIETSSVPGVTLASL